MNKHRKIIEKVTKHYFKSRDFNGISLENLFLDIELGEEEFKNNLIDLIKIREIDLIYEGDIPNPHIKPFPAPPINEQIEKLSSLNLENHIKLAENDAKTVRIGEKKITFFVMGIGCCVYPTSKYLRSIVDWKKYVSRPFTLRLAMGEHQLRPYFFELGILAVYRSDPRYRYTTDDITGSIYSTEDDILNNSDRIFLKQFGFGFDDNGVRVVAVLLCDLRKLSPEHQRIWQAKKLGESYKYKLHPDYRKSILGHFPDQGSIFTAFSEELRIINEMAQKIKGIKLFKNTFNNDDKPENFGFLILPTLREYELFCQTLDRMMSDNLEAIFFNNEIQQSDLSEGEILEKTGTIRKLEIWLNKTIRFSNHKRKDDMIKTFRKVRRLRSIPSHIYSTNQWDLNLFKQQQKLVNETYGAIRTLRLIFANHPKAKMVEVPDWLYRAEIRTF